MLLFLQEHQISSIASSKTDYQQRQHEKKNSDFRRAAATAKSEPGGKLPVGQVTMTKSTMSTDKASKGASNRILIWGQPSKTEGSGRQNTKKQAGARTHPGEHEKHVQGLFTKTRIVIERDFTGRGGDGKSPESLMLLEAKEKIPTKKQAGRQD
jgi:hypothetical protein